MGLEHLSDDDYQNYKKHGLAGLDDAAYSRLKLPAGYGLPQHTPPEAVVQQFPGEQGVEGLNPADMAGEGSAAVSDYLKKTGQKVEESVPGIMGHILAASPEIAASILPKTGSQVLAQLVAPKLISEPVEAAASALEPLGQKASSLLMQIGGKPRVQSDLLSKNLGSMYGGQSAGEAGEALGNATNKLELVGLDQHLKQQLGNTNLAAGATGPTVLPANAVSQAASKYVGDLGSEIVAHPDKYGNQELYNVVNSATKIMDNPSMYPGYENLRQLPAAQFKNLAQLKSAALDGIVQNEQANVAKAALNTPEKLAAMQRLESANHISTLNKAVDAELGDLHSQVQAMNTGSIPSINGENAATTDAARGRMGNSATDILGKVTSPAAQEGLQAAKDLPGLRKGYAVAKQAQSMNNVLPRNLNGSVSMVRTILAGALPGIGTLTQSPILQKALIGMVRGAYLGTKALSPLAGQAATGLENVMGSNDNGK